jgi:hypothetical protein
MSRTRSAFQRAVDQRADVGQHPVNLQPFAQGRHFRRPPASIRRQIFVIAAP